MQFTVSDLMRIGADTMEKELQSRITGKVIEFINVRNSKEENCYGVWQGDYLYITYCENEQQVIKLLGDKLKDKEYTVRIMKTEWYLFKVLKDNCYVGVYIDLYRYVDHEQIKEYGEMYVRDKTEFASYTLNRNNFDYVKINEENKDII